VLVTLVHLFQLKRCSVSSFFLLPSFVVVFPPPFFRVLLAHTIVFHDAITLHLGEDADDRLARNSPPPLGKNHLFPFPNVVLLSFDEYKWLYFTNAGFFMS